MSQSETFEVVVGAGAVGQAVARRLVAERIPVRLASRHGTAVAGAERRTVDASDPQEARELAAGARVVYFCPQPPIWAWSQLFPAAPGIGPGWRRIRRGGSGERRQPLWVRARNRPYPRRTSARPPDAEGRGPRRDGRSTARRAH
jgi:hypothetical protein